MPIVSTEVGMLAAASDVICACKHVCVIAYYCNRYEEASFEKKTFDLTLI